MYLLLTKQIVYNYFGLLMSYFVVGISCQLTTIAIMSSNLKNFRGKWRGRVLGLSGLSIGIAATLFGIVFSLFFSKNNYFLLFLSISCSILCFLGCLFVSIPREKVYASNWKKMMSRTSSDKAENTETLIENTDEDKWRPKAILMQVKFWLLFVIGFFGVSSGMLFLMVLLGSVYISHGGEHGGQVKKHKNKLLIFFSFIFRPLL
jgi:MFS family permease